MVMLTSFSFFRTRSLNTSTAKLGKELHTVCGTLAMTPKECLLSYRRYYKRTNAVFIAFWSTYCRRVEKRKLSPARVLQALISALAGGVISFTPRLLSPHLVEYLSE
jgi:hypothetical protein